MRSAFSEKYTKLAGGFNTCSHVVEGASKHATFFLLAGQGSAQHTSSGNMCFVFPKRFYFMVGMLYLYLISNVIPGEMFVF